jgi:hypothetical protein
MNWALTEYHLRASGPRLNWGKYVMTATVVGYATAFGVIVSALAVVYQIYKAHFNTNVQLVLEFLKQFNSSSFELKRQKAATAILANSEDVSGAEPIFDLFETVGYLVKKRAIADELALHTFYYWVHGYWTIGKMHIKKRRDLEKDIEVWNHFEYLHDRLLKLQRESANRSEPEIMNDEDRNRFLIEETELILDMPRASSRKS